MKTKIFSILTLLVLVVLLFSCGTNNEQTNLIDLNPVRTEAVATFASSLTQTLVARPTISPAPTIEPTLTLTPGTEIAAATPTKNRCYNLLYLKDVTIPDGTKMKPNEVFTKTWLVQNNGDCAWAPGFMFSNFGGDPMRGAALKLSKSIPVGLKYELSIDLVVPSGIYGLIQSSWRMSYEPDMYFGDTLSVNIVVEDPNQPTATAAP
ncbi:MAG: NBR1-Ig-like domain-containing protein [Anaerolineales bacterium]|nr:NBR1-Ig-like domain-containing protein [Anaerolineales bacterium]